MTQQWKVWVGVALLALGEQAMAAAQVSTIDAKSNIFYAGTTGLQINTTTANVCTYSGSTLGSGASTHNGKLGDGKVPPYLSLTSGVRSLQIVAKNTTAISYGTNYKAQRGSTPDGTLAPLRPADNNVTSVMNQSNTTNQGLAFANRFGVLASVFTNETLLDNNAVTFDRLKTGVATFTSTSMNAESVSPENLRDAFFIGDGTVVDFVDKNWPGGRPTTGGGVGVVEPGVVPAVLPTGLEMRQNIQPPNGATRMYFGVADGTYISGPNCAYQDNAGGIDITLKLTISDDSGAGKVGEAKTVIPSVLFNDTVDGSVPVVDGSTSYSLKPVAPADLPLYVTSAGDAAGSTAWDVAGDGINLDAATGAVSMAATTPAGIYKKWYQLCDNTTQPASCAVALATIEVAAAPVPLQGLQDQVVVQTNVPGTVAIANVRDNDSVDGLLASASNSSIEKDGVWNGFALNTATGAVSIEATSFGLPPGEGTYTLSYKLCVAGSSTNCVSVPVVITITAATASVPALQAFPDTASSLVMEGSAAPGIVNALTNDSYGGGPQGSATTANVKVEPVPGAKWPLGITMSSAGLVSVDASTAAGSYTLDYRICALAMTAQCSASTISITVQGVTITAADDYGTATSGTDSPNLLNVLTGDLYNGAAASLNDVSITPPTGWPTGISLETSTGEFSVAAAVTAGTYDLLYQICSKTVAGRCASASVHLEVKTAPVVLPPDTITAADDRVTVTNGADNLNVVNVLAGDTFGGAPANVTQVSIAESVDWPAGITLDKASGAVSVGKDVAAGKYDLPYQICAIAPHTGCANAVVRLTVTAVTPPALASVTPVPGLGHGSLVLLSLLTLGLAWARKRRSV